VYLDANNLSHALKMPLTVSTKTFLTRCLFLHMPGRLTTSKGLYLHYRVHQGCHLFL